MRKLITKIRARGFRALSADLLMITFVVFTGIGAYMILPAAGFITAGICCGVYGFLLGSD